MGYMRSFSSGSRYLARRIFGFAVINVIYSAANFLLSIFIARAFGVEQFGIYAVVISIVSTFSLVSAAGYDVLLMRAENENSFHCTMLSASATVLLISVVLSPLVGLLGYQGGVKTFPALAAVVLITYMAADNTVKLGAAIFLGAQGIYQATEKLVRVAALGIMLTSMWILGDGSNQGVIYSLLCAVGLSYFATNDLLSKKGAPVATLGSPSLRALAPGGLLLATSLLTNALIASDPIIISVVGDSMDVASYGAALRISTAGSIITYSINAAVMQALLKSAQGQHHPDIGRAVNVATAFSISFFILCVAFGEEMLALFGSGYKNAYPVLLILAATNLMSIAFGQTMTLMKLRSEEKRLAIYLCWALAIKLAIGIFLFERLGIASLAVGGLVAVVFWNLRCYMLLRIVHRVDPRGAR